MFKLKNGLFTTAGFLFKLAWEPGAAKITKSYSRT